MVQAKFSRYEFLIPIYLLRFFSRYSRNISKIYYDNLFQLEKKKKIIIF